MKTAEELFRNHWVDESNEGLIHNDEQALAFIKLIQLDAFKAGAKWAAARVMDFYEYPSTSENNIQHDILTATEQLTELPKI